MACVLKKLIDLPKRQKKSEVEIIKEELRSQLFGVDHQLNGNLEKEQSEMIGKRWKLYKLGSSMNKQREKEHISYRRYIMRKARTQERPGVRRRLEQTGPARDECALV